ncbi:hypothetical protein TcasGA2_TC012089 [Tribolium castaneum]|uniref:Uncharacterized protein n=1 Tax=Tribolium castaneum TaxID=7070 RepID=D6X214_TRICA|nr:hypothetical protein TcasGA2_TC012089 [Tribolium castaneum]
MRNLTFSTSLLRQTHHPPRDDDDDDDKKENFRSNRKEHLVDGRRRRRPIEGSGDASRRPIRGRREDEGASIPCQSGWKVKYMEIRNSYDKPVTHTEKVIVLEKSKNNSEQAVAIVIRFGGGSCRCREPEAFRGPPVSRQSGIDPLTGHAASGAPPSKWSPANRLG